MFFDNLQVTHTAGHILEETHYYPFGLAMAGISSRALNNIAPNNYKFNAGNELNENFGINLYETFYRLQDVQTGRFLSTDPLAEKYYGITTYNYAANNPVSINDPLGDQMKYPGDNGRMQKGPDGNYHTGRVSEMMWNEKGFFNYGEVYGFSGGDFGSSHALYNIRGMSSQSFLNQKQLLDDNAIWDVGKGQFGYWSYNRFDPTNNGYQEAAASGDQLQEVVVGVNKSWVVYEDQSNWGPWGTAIGLTVDWALGMGDDNRIFYNDEVANSFRDARVINQLRTYWYNQVNAGKKTVNDGVTNFLGRRAWTGGNFGFKGIIAAGLDPMEQFVGSFTPTISSDGCNLTFTIQNTSSFKSLMYGIAPDWYRSTFRLGGNMSQTYIFTEPINFNLIK